MIMLETDCDTCRHVEVCKYKNNFEKGETKWECKHGPKEQYR